MTTLSSRRLALMPVSNQHYEFLYQLAVDDALPWQWRGLTPSPENFVQSLWSHVLTQFVIVARRDQQPIGLITAYGANLHHRFCYIQTLLVPEYQRRGWPIEASVLFLDHLFATYDIRKVYGESPEFVFSSFESATHSDSAFVNVEGRFRDHIYKNGRYWDVVIVSITRSDWDAHRCRFGRLLGQSP